MALATQVPFHFDIAPMFWMRLRTEWGRECLYYATVNESKLLYKSVYEYVMYGMLN